MITKTILTAALGLTVAQAKTAPKDTILFYGNSMVERLLEKGDLEAYMQLSRKKNRRAPLAIRSLAWAGDEVGYRLRPEGYVRHLTKVLDEWKANTIVLGFGMNEAFHGPDGLEDFKKNYESYLNQLAEIHPNANFVILSPIAAEAKQYPSLGKVGEAATVAAKDNHAITAQALNKNIEIYTAAIKEIASSRKATFIDVYSVSKQAYVNSKTPLTKNGIHLNEAGNALISKSIASQLTRSNFRAINAEHFKELSLAVTQKQQYVAEIARPKNSVVYFGVRQRPKEYLAEIPRYHQLVEQSDKIIAKVLADPKIKFSSIAKPSLPALDPIKGKAAKRGNGTYKKPADAMAEFKVADGYEVSLFASEEEFPELRNPVQIAFDAEGRLWVVTMPSFPHTVPGLPQEDKIIILEDTDKDGKADKSTIYADGFDALDGITFHHKGPIISAQPNHVLAVDEDGDDSADTFTRLLEGIDMTDSHHGGMLAADPFGGIIFSDGVFHRSQYETPYGVLRGIDATTYRHDLNTKELRVEWQAATPNPWQPTFDKWGNFYQMYGDGLVLDGLTLTWTPLGVYHPFKHGSILGYGKGSAVEIISSKNFPEEYQQGIASASLLGNYTVSISKTHFDQGQAKASDRLDLVSSPNPAFRPAALAFGMDGALYISDFCSSIIGHAQHPMRDPGWDHKHGRIWRVVNKAKPTVTDYPKIKGESLNNLFSLLQDSDDLVRDHARIEIRKHGEKGIKALEQWIARADKKASHYEQSVLEVIFTSEGIGKTQPELLETLLQSKSPDYRTAALQTIRLQANRLENPTELIKSVLNDPHPRVQMALVDAIAHIQKEIPSIIDLSSEIKSKSRTVNRMIDDLKHGTESHKLRSIPVLSVSKDARVDYWKKIDEKKNVSTYKYDKEAPFNNGTYQTFVNSNKEQPALLGINCNYINIDVNGVRLLSDNERWSKDQQVSFTLNKGINVISMTVPDTSRNKASAVSIYDLTGSSIKDATVSNSEKNLDSLAKLYAKDQEKFAGAIKVQAVPHQLKFSPTEIKVKAGSDVRLIVENPDAMIHNFVIMEPGSKDKVGNLADQLAADPDGANKAYVPDAKEVLFATKLLNPNTNEELKFKAPSKPGSYPFLCTVPGHWRVMQGVIIVE